MKEIADVSAVDPPVSELSEQKDPSAERLTAVINGD
jgi:hypothetical protein